MTILVQSLLEIPTSVYSTSSPPPFLWVQMSNDRSPSLSSPWDIPEVSFEALEVQCSIHCHCLKMHTRRGRVQFSRNNLIVVRSYDRTVSGGYNRSYRGQDLPTNIVAPFRPTGYDFTGRPKNSGNCFPELLAELFPSKYARFCNMPMTTNDAPLCPPSWCT